MQAVFEEKGIHVMTDIAVRHVRHRDGAFTLTMSRATIDGDRLMVDDRLRTSASHIYAAGDCCALPHSSMSPRPRAPVPPSI